MGKEVIEAESERKARFEVACIGTTPASLLVSISSRVQRTILQNIMPFGLSFYILFTSICSKILARFGLGKRVWSISRAENKFTFFCLMSDTK
jgi:hypothetical protein